jgi:hypothetical protein
VGSDENPLDENTWLSWLLISSVLFLKYSQGDFQENTVSSCIIIIKVYIEQRMNPTFILYWKYVFHWTRNQIKSFTRPSVGKIVIGALSDITKTRADLIVETPS